MMGVAVFDLNGVFLLSRYLSDRFEEDYGVSRDEFLPVLKETMSVVRKPGAPSVYSLWKCHLEKWKVSMNENEFIEYWVAEEKINQEMVELVKELKKIGWKLVLISNNFRERTEYYREKCDFLKLFDATYFSWETGLVKPSKDCYEHILTEGGYNPSDCYYFDDSKNNLEVASTLGIDVHIFVDAKTTRNILLG